MNSENTDLWVDPNADHCAVMAAECFASLSGAASGIATRHFALPGIALTVESTGVEAAALLTAAFAHLETDGPVPTGEPLLWRIGDASAPDAFPKFPPQPNAMQDLGSFHSNREGAHFVERRQGMVSVYDHQKRVITSICQGVGLLENDLIAKPLLRFLMGLLHQEGIYLAHAALVGLNGQGLLVTGKGGMGKSTISAAALGGGLSFCSDDFVALQRVGDDIIGHSLYASLLLHPDQVARHPHFHGHCRASRSADVPKTVVILGTEFREQTVARLRVDAMAVPQVSGQQQSELWPMSRVAALRALAPTSVFSSPWHEVARARFLVGLAADLACFQYISGSDFAKIPDPIRERYGQ